MATEQATITSNIPIKLASLVKYNKLFSREVMHPAFHLILNRVGFVSAADYWVTPGGIGVPPSKNKPTMRTGRLLGSVNAVHRFSAGRLPSTMARFMDQAFSTSTKGFSGGKRESIRRVHISGNNITASIGTEVEYAEDVEETRPYLRPAAAHVAKSERALDILDSAINESFEAADI